MACYDSTMNGTATTATVAAGSTIGLNVNGNPSTMYHDGVGGYMFSSITAKYLLALNRFSTYTWPRHLAKPLDGRRPAMCGSRFTKSGQFRQFAFVWTVINENRSAVTDGGTTITFPTLSSWPDMKTSTPS